MPGAAIGVDRWRRHHDVSILIAAGGAGRYFGSQPRAKVSMMIMRLPRHGHGRGRAWGCSSAASGVSGSFGRAGRASSWRACAMFPGRARALIAFARAEWATLPPRLGAGSLRVEPEMFRRTFALIAALNARPFCLR